MLSFHKGSQVKYHLCIFFAIILLSIACDAPEKEPTTPNTWINTNHLDHLYEEIKIDSVQIGSIWIYAEAPDYHLVKDEDEGFTCVDDVARTLVFYCRQYTIQPNANALQRIKSLSEFLLFMQAENGYFYNFLLPGPQINKTHKNSQAIANWWSWRAFWALSEVTLLQSLELEELQSRCRLAMDILFDNMQNICPTSEKFVLYEGIPTPECLAHLGADQVAVILLGLSNYYQLRPNNQIKNLITSLGNLLLKVQHGDAEQAPYHAFLSWRNIWHAWGNSQAYALLYTGKTLQNQAFINAGINEVKYFYPYCLENGFISAFTLEKKEDDIEIIDLKVFDQIAYGLRPMIFASLEAFTITGDSTYAKTAGNLASWFFGNNPAAKVMYNPETGRTFDGIGSPQQVNLNSGAESTIEGLLSLQAIQEVPIAMKVLESYIEDQNTSN